MRSRPASLRIIESPEASRRLADAQAWLEAHAQAGAVIVSASRGAADDVARTLAARHGGAVGLHRFSFAQLAAHLAAPVLAQRGIAPATRMASEAVAARVAFEARQADDLDYFAPVARTPGFPRALARTIQELSLARVGSRPLQQLPLGGEDLARLLALFDRQFAAAHATDRAALFDAACEAPWTFRRLPVLLLDVPIESAVEFALARRVIDQSAETLVTIPTGDVNATFRLAALGTEIERPIPGGESDLDALRRHLFAPSQPPQRGRSGDVRLFSAPGEGRECIEIARRILEEARRGVRFDEMAVLLRSPAEYLGLLEDAFDRAGIRAWFDRGSRRPHPAGRAFLALLSCAVERLSAIRFAEYLSLGQVPSAQEVERLPAPAPVADDVVIGYGHVGPPAEDPERYDAAPPGSDPENTPVVDGTLRAPRKWERLIVDAAVIGGDAARWERRLNGLRAQFERQRQEEQNEEAESPRAAALERDIRNLQHLKDFALPVIRTLASWPAAATWREWLDRFETLAPRVLRWPERVTRAFAELRPMGAIGPVTLEEARDVLADRLRTLDEQPPADRFGGVFVGSPHQGRGRAFRVVFVPGLAERLFPQKPREDPMLLDEMRIPLAAGLFVQHDRAVTERLLLHLAVGAATDRLWLSYPRLDVSGARPRVPSFYVLDVMRAITGHIPNHETLQRDAAAAGGARLDWPAPQRPEASIDVVEHDLATLRELIDRTDRTSVRGHAHYLLGLNDALRRSVTRRWAHANGRWRPQDGLVRAAAAVHPMLQSQRLNARPYSVSALQKFATCPYQFVLSAIYRLEPASEPEPLQRLDPLTKGSIFHEVQAEFFRELERNGQLPVTAAGVEAALAVVDRVLGEVAEQYREELAPAIPRVWRDEIAALGRDLRVWVRRLPRHDGWIPAYFEYSFGLRDHTREGRDPRSVNDPVAIDGRFLLRGSIDLIERRGDSAELRITDHKTGRNRTTPRTVIGGGATLQPVIYGLAVEKLLAAPVGTGRLFYCTAAGGFTEHPIPLSDANRRAGLEALEIIDRAIELGFLPPAPAERACGWCDFRPVCGPNEAHHAKRKPAESLADLTALRSMP